MSKRHIPHLAAADTVPTFAVFFCSTRRRTVALEKIHRKVRELIQVFGCIAVGVVVILPPGAIISRVILVLGVVPRAVVPTEEISGGSGRVSGVAAHLEEDHPH